MTTKLADLAVKTGSYTKGNETKGRYENIGQLMQSDDGGMFVLLKPTVDMGIVWQLQRMDAKATGKEARDTIMVSCFADEGRTQSAPHAATRQQTASGAGMVDDDIAF